MRIRISFPLWSILVLVVLVAILCGSLRKLQDPPVSAASGAGLFVSSAVALLLMMELISYVVFTNIRAGEGAQIRAFGMLLILLSVPIVFGLVLGFLG